MHFKTTGTAKVRSVKCCVLFDHETGAIQHVHRVVTMEGVTEKTDAEIEARALKLANDHGIKTKKVEIAHVDAEAFATAEPRCVAASVISLWIEPCPQFVAARKFSSLAVVRGFGSGWVWTT